MLNWPNRLTIARILLVPLFIILLTYRFSSWALAVFLIAGATDALDGALARVWNQRTRLGTFLDPLADKLLLTAAFITLAALQAIPLWGAILVASRDVILVLGTAVLHILHGRVEVAPSLLGKATTVAQLGYVILVQVSMAAQGGDRLLWPALLLAIVLTVVSGMDYVYRGVRMLGTSSQSSP